MESWNGNGALWLEDGMDETTLYATGSWSKPTKKSVRFVSLYRKYKENVDHIEKVTHDLYGFLIVHLHVEDFTCWLVACSSYCCSKTHHVDDPKKTKRKKISEQGKLNLMSYIGIYRWMRGMTLCMTPTRQWQIGVLKAPRLWSHATFKITRL